MRWNSPAKQKSWEWHQWFAWHPVRVPADRYEDGQWVWLETVWRQERNGWTYATEDPRPAEKATAAQLVLMLRQQAAEQRRGVAYKERRNRK